MKQSVISSVPSGRRVVVEGANFCAVCDIGRVRINNEDGFYISPDGRLFIVADGMGGEAAGEVASALAIQAVAGSLCQSLPRSTTDAAIRSALVAALGVAHSTVLTEANRRLDWRNMGCALLALYVHGDHFYTCHAGDVRCYHLGHDGFEQVSADHSLVAQLLKDKHLTIEEARNHPQKGVILQAIGSNSGIRPDINRRRLMGGDRLLLCSDGLWEALPSAELCSVLSSEGAMRQLATVLADRANANGGYDNVTVITYEQR